MSSLYNDYARRFELWEECLSIVHSCDLDDPAEVQELYRRIVEEHDGAPLATWVPVVGGIVQRLGRLYFNNRGNFAFPYAFLIGWLERENVLRQMRLGQGLDRHDDWLDAYSRYRGFVSPVGLILAEDWIFQAALIFY